MLLVIFLVVLPGAIGEVVMVVPVVRVAIASIVDE